MSALICGSFAFDTIMVFHDRFKNHILPEQVHILNVSFLVPDLRREFGGCAGNIAYNLKLLGGAPLPMGTVGQDFHSYARWMDQVGVERTHVSTVEHTYTAQAFITTDVDDNQITAFHPGAMNFSHHTHIDEANGVHLGIVSPDGREGMLQHAEQFADANIPFIFDPGQGMPMFNGEELAHFLDLATWITLNDYEFELMQERTGLDVQQMAKRVEALIITRGAKGSSIYTGTERLDIPSAPIDEAMDPTGCGDAYRAGLLYGLENGLDWATTGRIATLLGAIKIETHGTQNHSFDRDTFASRFEHAFAYRPW